jgi:hypothetical protein
LIYIEVRGAPIGGKEPKENASICTILLLGVGGTGLLAYTMSSPTYSADVLGKSKRYISSRCDSAKPTPPMERGPEFSHNGISMTTTFDTLNRQTQCLQGSVNLDMTKLITCPQVDKSI